MRLSVFVVVALSFVAAWAVPTYVMMPLDTVGNDGSVDEGRLSYILSRVKQSGADGVMLDVWWGIVENSGPRQYNWAPYSTVFNLIRQADLKLQVVMSFHQCGGNVGDTCYIPLPQWVLEVGQANPNIFYTDREGHHDQEYLSLGVDNSTVLLGRTPVGVYQDFFSSFASNFSQYYGNTLTQVQIGMGPAGELRYPSYQNAFWNFPGIGEFQCYDTYMLASVKKEAENQGHPEWGLSGPDNAGTYNDQPQSNAFFNDNGSWNTDYGRFFLGWYSKQLIAHGESILQAARGVFRVSDPITLSVKISGIHWWYGTRSHAAEVTAGYYNVDGRDGYQPIVDMMAKYGAFLDFTMLEMTDNDNPGCESKPEELIRQAFTAATNRGLAFGGENALPRFDQAAYSQIQNNARINGKVLESFTYLRWSDDLNQDNNFSLFSQFVGQMHGITRPSLISRMRPGLSLSTSTF